MFQYDVLLYDVSFILYKDLKYACCAILDARPNTPCFSCQRQTKKSTKEDKHALGQWDRNWIVIKRKLTVSTAI